MKIGELCLWICEHYTLIKAKKQMAVTVATKATDQFQVGSHFHFFEVNKMPFF